MKKPKPKKKPAKRGPKPELLEPFNGTFKEAVQLAFSKGKPPKGWDK